MLESDTRLTRRASELAATIHEVERALDALRVDRARMAAGLHAAGWSVERIAESFGLSEADLGQVLVFDRALAEGIGMLDSA